jgi:short-subunit dehydrogenase
MLTAKKSQRTPRMHKVLVLGATSGIAVAITRDLAQRGCELLLVARSERRLSDLKADLVLRGAGKVDTYAADLASLSQHLGIFEFAQHSLPDFDTVLLAYGCMHDQTESENNIEVLVEQINVNFVSACALLTLAASILELRRSGCIAAITSVAGDRGRRSNYTYGAAKGALSLFLQGLRSRLHAQGVKVLAIKPGPVQTSMTDHFAGAYRFARPEAVAHRIADALERRSPDVLYTPWFWGPVMRVVRQVPEAISKRMNW